jgi:stearoyl-CoA desaturase (Delta-9 desaturase)
VWIDRNYDLICIFSIVLPGLIGLAWYQTSVGFVDGMMWGGLGRIAVVINLTWAINAACHMTGEMTYRVSDKSHNIPLLGWLVFGEGYHNNHHAFPFSPRMGIDKGQVDLGWQFIVILSKLGLIFDLKTVPDEQTRQKRRIIAK